MKTILKVLAAVGLMLMVGCGKNSTSPVAPEPYIHITSPIEGQVFEVDENIPIQTESIDFIGRFGGDDDENTYPLPVRVVFSLRAVWSTQYEVWIENPPYPYTFNWSTNEPDDYVVKVEVYWWEENYNNDEWIDYYVSDSVFFEVRN